LKVPVRFLAGKHDALRTPALVKELVAKVKGATFDEVDSGHFMHVQTPALVAATLKPWIDAHRGAQ